MVEDGGTLDDRKRLKALDSYDILDTPAEAGFDDIVVLACQICDTPAALVSLVAGDRQWFKARIGFDPCETPLDQSVCRHALKGPGLLVIPDLTADPRTSGNPLVTGEPHLRFYAGARLETPEGVAIGTLCVIDAKPRPEGLTTAQAKALEALARQVMSQMELRRTSEQRRRSEEFLRSVLASSNDCIKILDLDANLLFMSEGGRRVDGSQPTSRRIRGRAWPTFWTCPDERFDPLRTPRSRPRRRWWELDTYRGSDRHLRGARPKWWDVRVTPILDAARASRRRLLARSPATSRSAHARRGGAARGRGAELADPQFERRLYRRARPRRAHAVRQSGRHRGDGDLGRRRRSSACRGCASGKASTTRSARKRLRRGDGPARKGQFQGFCPTHKGMPKWWDVVISPLLGPDGRPERLVSVGRDITASRQVAEKLVRSQERLKLGPECLRHGRHLGLGPKSRASSTPMRTSRGSIRSIPDWAARGAPLSEYVKNIHPDDLPSFQSELDRLFAGRRRVLERIPHKPVWTARSVGCWRVDGWCGMRTGLSLSASRAPPSTSRIVRRPRCAAWPSWNSAIGFAT